MKKLLLSFTAVILIAFNTNAQHKKLSVLFLGDSYTAPAPPSKSIPEVMNMIAVSLGDTFINDSYAPPSHSLKQHAVDPSTAIKIAAGFWNYVVLQEQSPLLALNDAEVDADVKPYARTLDSLVHKKNSCGRSVFFQTWANKNGDPVMCPTHPSLCTYKGMDTLIQKRVQDLSLTNEGIIAPVAAVFTELAKFAPGIDLYLTDDMHTSDAGTYAAAVTLYTVLYGTNPKTIVFPYTISPLDADLIRQAVFNIVYTSLPKYFVGKYDPKAGFTSSVAGNTATFATTTSVNVANYNWDFGDGGTSTLANPLHTYAAPGIYNVRLIGDNCILKDTAKNTVEILKPSSIINENSLLKSISVYPNPAAGFINITAAAGLENTSVNISNILGVSVFNDAKYANQPINIQSLSTGIYLLNIKDNASGESITTKFMKN